jgi:hypothetical protein
MKTTENRVLTRCADQALDAGLVDRPLEAVAELDLGLPVMGAA